MSLTHIHDRCTEMKILTAEGWPATSEEQTKTLARVDALRGEIRDLVRKHNSAVLKVVRQHHPDEPHVKPDELKDPIENLQSNWELVNLPNDVDCLEPLPLDAVETNHPNVPAYAAAMHRFATIVSYQTGTLLMEAERVHQCNAHGGQVSRLPHPGGEVHEPIIDHA